jgi:hypothetical protein
MDWVFQTLFRPKLQSCRNHKHEDRSDKRNLMALRFSQVKSPPTRARALWVADSLAASEKVAQQQFRVEQVDPDVAPARAGRTKPRRSNDA